MLLDVLVEGRRFRGDKGRRRGDRTYVILEVVQVAGIGLGAFFAERVTAADLPGRWVWPLAACALEIAGMALRLWSINTLGAFFTRYVQVADDHRVVTDGPYRFVRHPSYTGALLMFAGIGIGLGNWLAIPAVFGCALVGYLVRISHEEALLHERLGQEYDEFAAGKRRLIPGVW